MNDPYACPIPASQVFKEALALIDSPHKWIRRMYASIDGWPVPLTDPLSCKFCSLGAILRTVHKYRPRYGYELYEMPEFVKEAIKIAMPAQFANGGLADLNDFGGYDAVQKFFAEAIKVAKLREEEDAKRNDQHEKPSPDTGEKHHQ